MVVLRRAMLGAGTHRDPVLSILSGDNHPEVQLICARPITSSLEPGVRILHRPCRPLLRGLEQAHRAALDDHVHRPTRLGQWVLISGSWYERIATGFRWAEGPVYIRDYRRLIWSDIPNNRMMSWNEEDGHVSVFPTHRITPTATRATDRAGF